MSKRHHIYFNEKEMKKIEELLEWYQLDLTDLIKHLINQEYVYIKALKEGVNNTLKR